MQEFKIIKSGAIESNQALEIDLPKMKCELEFATIRTSTMAKSHKEQLVLDSRLELEAFEYQTELKYARDLENELVNEQKVKENSHFNQETSNVDRSFENLSQIASKANSNKSEFVRTKMKFIPEVFLHSLFKS